MQLAPDQWLVMILALLLGFLLGLAIMASPKWRKRYRKEAQLRAEENRAHMQERKRWAIEAQQLQDHRRRQEAQQGAERARQERTAA